MLRAACWDLPPERLVVCATRKRLGFMQQQQQSHQPAEGQLRPHLLNRWHPEYQRFSYTCSRNFEPRSYVYSSEPQELCEPPDMSRNMSCGKRISQSPTYKSQHIQAHVTRGIGSCCGVPHFHCKHTILVFDFVTPFHRTHQPPCTVNYSSYSIATASTCNEFRFSCYSSHRPEKPPITAASSTAKYTQVSGM